MAVRAPIFKKFFLQSNTEFNEHATDGLVSGQERTDGQMGEHGHNHICRAFFFRRFRRIKKNSYWPHHVCLSVRPHGTTLLPPDRFSLNLIFEYFSKLDVRESVHRDMIIKVTNKMQLYRLIYYSKSALHVSDDVFAHHQEHLTVFTVSGSTHPSCCRLVSWMSWNCFPTHP
jgi:hypothetical protein